MHNLTQSKQMWIINEQTEWFQSNKCQNSSINSTKIPAQTGHIQWAAYQISCNLD
jgi:hypothetical protein